MKRCPYCNIEVGGNLVKCPLCQSKLTGNGGEDYFPKPETRQIHTFFYKLQLLIVWALLIVGLALDFMLSLKIKSFPDLHWSLILAMWLAGFEFGIVRQFRPATGSARKVTLMVLLILTMLLITAYFFRFSGVILDLVTPIVLACMIVADFVLVMADKKGNTMAYLLSGLLLGVIPSIVLRFIRPALPLAWSICMMISIILFIGAVIFKGRAVAAEIQRRLNV